MKISTKICMFSILFFCIGNLIAQPQVTISATTVSYGGNYAPKICFAMWITNENGDYIRTINYQGERYAWTLETCNAASDSAGYVHTDGVTGATLNVHNWPYASPSTTIKRLPHVWDCTDQDGNEVPDGTYYVHIEFTENNWQGPYIQFAFEKGDTDQVYSRENVETEPGKWFQDVSVDFKADAGATSIGGAKKTAFDYIVYRLDSKVIVSAEGTDNEVASVEAYDLTGQKIAESEGNSVDLDGYSGLAVINATCIDNSTFVKKVVLE